MTAPGVEPAPPGFEHAALFTSVDEEYAALRAAAAIVDRSARARLVMAGPQAAETLTGLVTNDVGALRPGAGQYAAALTAKGKVIADVRIFARAGDLLLDTPASAGPGLSTMLRKYVNPRLATFTDASAALRTIGVFGPLAHAALSAVLVRSGAPESAVAALRGLGDYHHLTFDLAGANINVARVPDLGGEGFDCFVPAEIAALLWSQLEAARAVPTGSDATEIARVEAGRPLWGVDMDETTLAQEANFDALGAISYTKGCYTGQETVARVHFRGHVNRYLRGMRGTVRVLSGAELFDGDKPVGSVRSSVESPRLGPIALAMVKRDVSNGSELIARWDGGEHPVRVRELPFE